MSLFEDNIKYKFLFKLLNSVGTIFLFETEGNYGFFQKKFRKVHQLSNFIDSSDYYETTKPMSLPLKMVFIGQISYMKGIDIVLDLMIKNKKIFIDIYGPQLSNSKLTKDQLEVFESAYKGTLEWSEIPSVLSKYHLMILPSRKEGYPSIVLECLASKLPMILSDLPTLKEMIQHSALFVDPNVKSLESAIEQISIIRWEFMANAAEKEVSQFEEKVVIEGLINVLL